MDFCTLYEVVCPSIGKKGLLIGFVLACAAGYGLGTLRASHDPLSWHRATGDIKRSMDVMDNSLGGASEFSLFLKKQHDDENVLEATKLQAIYRIRSKILSYKTPKHGVDVQTALSVTDPLRQSLRASGSQLTF